MAIVGTLLPAIAVQAQINDFEVSHVYKTASSLYEYVNDDGEKKGAMVDVALQWPAKFGDNDVSALQDTILNRAFEYSGTDPDVAISQYLSREPGYGDYEMTRVDLESDTSRHLDIDRLRSVHVSTIGFCERYLVYKCHYLEDGEGSHPNYFTSFINYDVFDNRMMLYNDIFKPGHEEQLLEIITQKLLDKYYASSLENLRDKTQIFIDNLFVTREIYLTGDEVVFHYNPYDIAPWATGEIEVGISFDSLFGFFTPHARQLLSMGR